MLRVFGTHVAPMGEHFTLCGVNVAGQIETGFVEDPSDPELALCPLCLGNLVTHGITDRGTAILERLRAIQAELGSQIATNWQAQLSIEHTELLIQAMESDARWRLAQLQPVLDAPEVPELASALARLLALGLVLAAEARKELDHAN